MSDHKWEARHYAAVALLLICLGVLLVVAAETMTIVRTP